MTVKVTKYGRRLWDIPMSAKVTYQEWKAKDQGMTEEEFRNFKNFELYGNEYKEEGGES